MIYLERRSIFGKTLWANTAKALFALSQMRDMADKIILEVWNQVEKYYSLLPETERWQNAANMVSSIIIVKVRRKIDDRYTYSYIFDRVRQ